MYYIITAEDKVEVAPTKLNLPLEEAIKQSLAEKYEGTIIKEAGVILAIIGVNEIGEGIVLPNNPAVHYNVKSEILVWRPIEHEIVEGEVVDITDFGAFIRIGAIDGLVHISQVMDDYVNFDEKNMQLVGRETKRILKVGDVVRGRIISVSFKEQKKITLTMRQPFLGALRWLTAPGVKKEAVEKKSKKKKKKEPKKGGERGK